VGRHPVLEDHDEAVRIVNFQDVAPAAAAERGVQQHRGVPPHHGEVAGPHRGGAARARQSLLGDVQLHAALRRRRARKSIK
jgi:hypothetical protein